MHLEPVLNLRYFPSQVVERQVHPEVEFQDNQTLLMEPVLICKSDQEACLIESSINSVRISIKIKKGMEIEHLLTRMLERFMALRADKFEIFRKKVAHEGYDFSFLISANHLLIYRKEELINFVLEFVAGIDKEINELKLDVINSARFAANFFTNACSNNDITKWVSIKLSQRNIENATDQEKIFQIWPFWYLSEEAKQGKK